MKLGRTHGGPIAMTEEIPKVEFGIDDRVKALYGV